MKKILLVAIFSLSGCSVFDAYFMAPYDSSEYFLITDIRSKAQQYKNQCDNAEISKANAIKLSDDTQRFALYSEHIPHNDNVISASKDLHTIAQGLADQYNKTDKVSIGFCKIKFTSVETSADKMQTIIGSRPR
jgi:hypothetical protein